MRATGDNLPRHAGRVSGRDQGSPRPRDVRLAGISPGSVPQKASRRSQPRRPWISIRHHSCSQSTSSPITPGSARSTTRASSLGRPAQLAHRPRHHDRAPARQQAGMDPALVGVVEPDLSPGVELGDDLDRQALAREHPADRVFPAGAEAQVDPVGAERDEPRQGQPGAPTGAGQRRARRRGATRGSSLPGPPRDARGRASPRRATARRAAPALHPAAIELQLPRLAPCAQC